VDLLSQLGAKKSTVSFFISFFPVLFGIAPKRTKSRLWFLGVFHKNFTKPISGLVRLNLSPRKSQNFRPLRKALKVAHFGFPPSAGPENGRARPPFEQENLFNYKTFF
jgi:hypothetical protein